LMVALRALGWRGEVIIASFGFAGTAHAIRWAGGEPVFAEVDRQTFLLDPASVGRMTTDRTVGILVTEAYGVPADLDALAQVTDVPVLADGAHALGARRKSERVPAARVYSMHPTKTIVAGEGGLIATDDAGLDGRLRRVRNFGFGARGQDATEVGLNAKLPELSAILAYHQLELLSRTIHGRAAWDAVYREVLDGTPGIAFQRVPTDVEHNYQYTPVLIRGGEFGRSRDEVAAALLDRGIVTRPYFSPPIHRMEAYSGRLRTDDLTWTEELSASVLCLPVHPGESPDGAERVAGMIRGLAR
ncbi:MAG: DegT/DnrJ/EryC1/StrS family aminotransferase, partial [Actinomycetota bacterium]